MPTYHTYLPKYSSAVIPMNLMAIIKNLPPFHFQATDTISVNKYVALSKENTGQLFCSRLWE